METAGEKKQCDAGEGVNAHLVLDFNRPDAKGRVELKEAGSGVDIILDGQVLAHLDLYYRSQQAKDADNPRNGCALLCLAYGEVDYQIGAYISKPDADNQARLVLVREGAGPTEATVWSQVPPARYWISYESNAPEIVSNKPSHG